MSDELRSGVGDLPSEEIPAEEAASRQRVAATLERVQAGVRQRRAELATVGGGREDTRLRLAELKSLEWVEEPTPVSPRPGVGRLLVFVRKAFFHLFHKWYARPVLHQQNGFNRAAAELLAELARRLEDSEAQVARLTSRVRELEGSAQEDGVEEGREER